MVNYNAATKVFDSQLRAETGGVLEFKKWQVFELVLTVDKLKWIWDEMNRYRSLFSDLTRGNPEIFYDLISQKDTLWLEVREEDKMVGIIYWTSMAKMIDADIHVIFFDRKLTEKAELCREIGKWFFETCPEFNRVTATLPEIYYATIRLARKIGMKEEGRKRQSQMLGGKLVDEFIFGLTVEDLK